MITAMKGLNLPVFLAVLLTSAIKGEEGVHRPVFRGMDTEILNRRRCVHTLGSWCHDFLTQVAIPTKPAPRGDKECPNACSKVGQCQYDFGLCDCPAGRQGKDCSEPDKRPCYNMGQDRRDRDYHMEPWLASRCAGVCDDNRAMCWCDKGKYKHEMRPSKDDPLAPPIKRGRPMLQCHMGWDKQGRRIPWAPDGHPYEDLFGASGWCNADKPNGTKCTCWGDGLEGEFCDIPTEHFCLNQCSGHGHCMYGFCRCDPDWYGQDCTRRKKGAKDKEDESQVVFKPYLAELVVRPPAAMDVPPKQSRRRPLIYIYDLPSKYYRRMIEYRNNKEACTWRRFDAENNTLYEPSAYSVEQLLHEALLQSEHRTFDPEEADFFYVPVYTSCFFWPIHGYADKPAYPALGGPRPSNAAMMLLEAKKWLQRNHPWWDRHGGKDHIILLGHDEGACWAPTVVMNATLLVHWGRMDMNDKSQTGFWMDNFDEEFVVPGKMPDGWIKHIKPHVCYDPRKDLVIPGIKSFDHFEESHFLGAPKRPRDLLLFFRGDFREGDKEVLAVRYSRGLRQTLRKLAKENKWDKKYNITIVGREESWQPYGVLMSRAKFALVLPGDGWSGRMQDAVVYGAIPVIIMDNTHEKFESILNFTEFSLRVNESDLAKLPTILLSVSSEKVRAMRKVLSNVWHRFLYISHPFLRKGLRQMIAKSLENPEGGSSTFEAANKKSSTVSTAMSKQNRQRFIHQYWRNLNMEDDAIATIIQWLHSRIPFVKDTPKYVKDGPQGKKNGQATKQQQYAGFKGKG